MSTAHATITFYRFDPAREHTILAALRIHGFRFEYVDTVAAPLRMSRTYGVREASTLICDQLGTLMRQLDRSAVFTICQNSNHEFVGQVLTSDPELGDYVCPADEEGAVLVPAAEMRRAVNAAQLAVAAGVGAATAITELDRLTGGPWQRRVEELCDHSADARTSASRTASGTAA